MIPRWAEKYINVEPLDGGRTFAGADCEGICRLMMEVDGGNPSIPPYGIASADGLLAVAKAIHKMSTMPPWVPADPNKLQSFDWVLLYGREEVDGRDRSVVCHLGIMVTPTWMIHTEKWTKSVAVPLTHQTVKHRIYGFVRHEALA